MCMAEHIVASMRFWCERGKVEDIWCLCHESVSQTIGFVQLGCPAATPSVLVYYQSVSFDPHGKIFIDMEWKRAVFDQILGKVYRVSRADSVYLCLCTCYHLLSTMHRRSKTHRVLNRRSMRAGVVLLYSPKTSPHGNCPRAFADWRRDSPSEDPRRKGMQLPTGVNGFLGPRSRPSEKARRFLSVSRPVTSHSR